MLITINNGQLKVFARKGQTVRDALASNEINLGVCGGRGICGKCKIKIADCKEPPNDIEKGKLTGEELSNGFRLACQVQAQDGMNVQLPDEDILKGMFEAVCTAITELTCDIRMFRFDMPQGQTLDYTPGQYIQLTTPKGIEGCPRVTRTFSISSDPSDKSYFELIIRRTPNGLCTKFLFENLKIGQKIEFIGPDGDFYLSNTDKPIVMVAGGSGMSAIRCLLYEMKRTQSTRKTIYFFGAPSPEGIYMLDEMREFEQILTDFKFVPCVQSDPDGLWEGEKGLVTDAVSRNLENCKDAEGYLCGAPGMIEAAIKVLHKIGIKEDNIFYDSFG